MKVLLTSHGRLAQGIVSSYEFIAGKSTQIETLELDESGIDSYSERLIQMLSKETEPILILADLKGGTPYNESYKYYLAHKDKVRIISGVNLPMLLELIPQLNKVITLDEAVQLCLQTGTAGICEAEDDQNDDNDIEF